jgi:hypothetical protein
VPRRLARRESVRCQVAYAGAATVAPLILPDVDRISPLKAASSIPESARVLILAAGADRRACAAEARAIFERIQSHARLLVVPEADHLRLLVTRSNSVSRSDTEADWGLSDGSQGAPAGS